LGTHCLATPYPRAHIARQIEHAAAPAVSAATVRCGPMAQSQIACLQPAKTLHISLTLAATDVLKGHRGKQTSAKECEQQKGGGFLAACCR